MRVLFCLWQKIDYMESNNRLCWIDGIKGISAIIVLVSHIFIAISGYDRYNNCRFPILHNFWDGNFAVHIFIILSAILVCHGINLHRDDIIHYYSKIILKRYFRLLFPAGVIIIMMFVMHRLGLFYSEEYGQKTNNGWLIGQFISLRDLPGCIFAAPLGKCYKVLNVGWMLGYCFFASFWIVIIDLLCYDKSNRTRMLLLSICCYIAYRMDFYYVNVVIAYLLFSFRDVNLITKRYLLLFCGFIFCASDFIRYTEMWSMLRAICFIVMVFFSPKLQQLFSGVFQKLGKISLNIYLLQLMIIYIYTCRVADVLPQSIEAYVYIYLSSILLTILSAYFYTKYVETHLNMFISSLLKNFQ